MSAPRRRMDKPRVWTAAALAKVRVLYEAGDLVTFDVRRKDAGGSA